MTLDAIVAQFPNGWHDAFLRGLAIDYIERRVTLALSVWMGDLHAATDAERECYRPHRVTISGLLWFIVESPAELGPQDADGLWIDAGPTSALKSKPNIPPVPDGAFSWLIFVRPWNAFIYIAGMDARLEARSE